MRRQKHKPIDSSSRSLTPVHKPVWRQAPRRKGKSRFGDEEEDDDDFLDARFESLTSARAAGTFRAEISGNQELQVRRRHAGLAARAVSEEASAFCALDADPSPSCGFHSEPLCGRWHGVPMFPITKPARSA